MAGRSRRSLAVGLLMPFVVAIVLAILSPGPVEAGVDRRSRDWVANVVSRITAADRDGAGVGRAGGTVTVRVRVAADGTVVAVGIDDSSGVQDLDERAIRAVRAAGPFGRPPSRLLTLEGFTELSFPLQLGVRTLR